MEKITIDKQHRKPHHPKLGSEDYLHILTFDEKNLTFKVSIHFDYSYPAQSKVFIQHWSNNSWIEVHTFFSSTIVEKYQWDIPKIEKDLIEIADKILNPID